MKTPYPRSFAKFAIHNFQPIWPILLLLCLFGCKYPVSYSTYLWNLYKLLHKYVETTKNTTCHNPTDIFVGVAQLHWNKMPRCIGITSFVKNAIPEDWKMCPFHGSIMLGGFSACGGTQSNFATEIIQKRSTSRVYIEIHTKISRGYHKISQPSSLNCCPTGTSGKNFLLMNLTQVNFRSHTLSCLCIKRAFPNGSTCLMFVKNHGCDNVRRFHPNQDKG